MISGKPVSSETSVTAMPASAIAFAVPPVETSSTPALGSAVAKSTSPVLSETESRARRTRHEIGRRNVLGGDGHDRKFPRKDARGLKHVPESGSGFGIKTCKSRS